MAADEDYENIELQERHDDCDNIYANVEIKTTPAAQQNDSQKTLQSGERRYQINPGMTLHHCLGA